MSTMEQEFEELESKEKLFAYKNGLIPQQIKEVKQLLVYISKRLEECALQWQSEISLKQWQTFNSKSLTQMTWKESLLPRMYFTDVVLDNAFQDLLEYNKFFSVHLQNFIALLEGQYSVMNTKEVHTDVTQHMELVLDNITKRKFKPINLCLFKNPRKKFKKKCFATNATHFVATKPCNFKKLLHKKDTVCANDSNCLCDICTHQTKKFSGMLDTEESVDVANEGHKYIRTRKYKRIHKSTIRLAKRKSKNPSMSAGYVSN